MAHAPHHLRNTLAYALPEFGWGMTWALTIDGPMVAAYRDAFQGPQSFVGLAWLIGSLGIGGLGLVSAFWVEPLKNKRAFVFWGHLAGAIVMLLTALAIRFVAPLGPTAACTTYLVGTGLFFVSVGILLPGWLAFVGELFHAGGQARVFGITFLCNKVAAVFAGQFIAQQVLATTWTPADQWSFLFLCAGVAGFLGSFPFLWIIEPPRPRPTRTTLRAYFRELTSALVQLPGLRRFIAADAVGIATILTLTYAADAAIQVRGFPASLAGHWVAVGALSMALTTAVVAWRSEHVHPRTWFLCGILASVGAALAAAYGCSDFGSGYPGSHLAWDLAAGGVGIYMGVRVSCHAAFVMRLAPGRDGSGPIGVAVAAIMIVQGAGPVLGGVVIDHSGYLPVFVTVAALGLISFVMLVLRVPADVDTCAATGSESAGEG